MGFERDGAPICRAGATLSIGRPAPPILALAIVGPIGKAIDVTRVSGRTPG